MLMPICSGVKAGLSRVKSNVAASNCCLAEIGVDAHRQTEIVPCAVSNNLTGHQARGEFVRQTGRTTKQLESAPKGSLFICHHQPSVKYTKRLASHIGRQDIDVVPLSQFDFHSIHVFYGRKYSGVTIDHDCCPALKQWSSIKEIKLRCVREII